MMVAHAEARDRVVVWRRNPKPATARKVWCGAQADARDHRAVVIGGWADRAGVIL